MKRFLKAEVVLSVIIPIIISIGAYFISADRMMAVNQTKITAIEEQLKDTVQVTNSHITTDTKEGNELLMELRVVSAKVDMIYNDLQELKKEQHHK